ncbi:MAG: hypothetical protein ACK42I_04065 [Thermomicrobium sp.]
MSTQRETKTAGAERYTTETFPDNGSALEVATNSNLSQPSPAEPVTAQLPTEFHPLPARQTTPPGSPSKARNRTTILLTLLSAVLSLIIASGGVLTFLELNRRITEGNLLRGQVASLTQANLDFQTQVQSLTGERDRLTSERDRLVARVGELETKNAEQEKQIRELTAQVQEQRRQLSQSRAEASRQQQRADTAEQSSFSLAQVVAIDDEIHAEFRRFSTAVLEMQDTYYLGNRLAFESAARRAEESAQKLDQLFAQHNPLLDQLRQ